MQCHHGFSTCIFNESVLLMGIFNTDTQRTKSLASYSQHIDSTEHRECGQRDSDTSICILLKHMNVLRQAPLTKIV